MSDPIATSGAAAAHDSPPLCDWTEAVAVTLLLVSCAAHPPRRRLVVYRFAETATRFVGQRAKLLERLYDQSEPPVDSLAWRQWLAEDAQQAIADAIRVGRPRSAPWPIYSWRTRMPTPTSDPLALHSRLIGALCEDLASPEYRRTGATPRADALKFPGPPPTPPAR